MATPFVRHSRRQYFSPAVFGSVTGRGVSLGGFAPVDAAMNASYKGTVKSINDKIEKAKQIMKDRENRQPITNGQDRMTLTSEYTRNGQRFGQFTYSIHETGVEVNNRVQTPFTRIRTRTIHARIIKPGMAEYIGWETAWVLNPRTRTKEKVRRETGEKFTFSF